MLIIALIVIGLAILGTIGGTVLSTPANVQKIAVAIAAAEGFYVNGSRPQRNHNPGDMTADLIGRSVGMDGPFVVYATDEDGWNNLYQQIQLWLDGKSSHATAASTISDISQFYTDTDNTTWATNVANHLGVSLDTPIGEIS